MQSNRKTIVAVRRDDRFSPNSAEKDRAILALASERLAERLGGSGSVTVRMVDETDLKQESAAPALSAASIIILSMARSEEALQRLSKLEQQGACVVNTPQGVRTCQRSVLDRLMRQYHVAMPPREGNEGYWLKRGDAAAQSKDDIVYCRDSEELEKARRQFARRGITDVVVSAHVAGDLVKFYGVQGTEMFRIFYPGDDGLTKFGDEERNGKPHHYTFSEETLRQEAGRLATLTGVTVYGGDAIVSKDGKLSIIDYNDWPSFSRCRDEAAEAIAQAVESKANKY